MNRTKLLKKCNRSWWSLSRKEINRFLNPSVKNASGNLLDAMAQVAAIHGNAQMDRVINEIFQMADITADLSQKADSVVYNYYIFENPQVSDIM